MPKVDSYTEGTPSWVDLQTTDQAGAKAFYGGLFGWRFDDLPMPGGVYSMAEIDGETVAAIAPQPPPLAAAGAPPMWNTYIAVDDVDASASKVVDAGGQVLMPPTDINDAGRMAFVADPSGAAVGLWQAARHIGATLVNEPGTLIWNELVSNDLDSAVPFYESVVGLSSSEMDMGGGSMYTVFNVGDRAVAGAMTPPMEGMPNFWGVYFSVGDIAAAVAKVTELGGSVAAPVFDVAGVGKMAVLADPQGAFFSLMQSAPASA